MAAKSSRALGKGLDLLIPNAVGEAKAKSENSSESGGTKEELF